MARGFIRKPSFWKTVGAYRSQWKRSLRRFFIPGYGRKGMGWWRPPKKALYNWWYHRTSISLPRTLGYKPSRGACIFAMFVGSLFSLVAFPFDITNAGVRAHKIKKSRTARAKRAASRSQAKRRSSESSARSSTASHVSTGTSRSSTTIRTEKEPTAQSTAASHASTGTSRSSTASADSSTGKESTIKSPKSSEPKTASPKSTSNAKTSTRYTAAKTTPRSPTPPKPAVTATVVSVSIPDEDKKTKRTYSGSFTPLFAQVEIAPPADTPSTPAEPDESTPKSKPKHESDQFIRKRMIIAGSSYCDNATVSRLTVGTYFDLVAEPDNPHDKNAIMLVWNGTKIGYVPKSDRMAYVSCLKLKRKVYGVITNIQTASFPTRYEFETWFDME